MTDRRRYLLIGLAVFLVGVAMRTLPLHWTSLPYNVDGYHFAALARKAGAAGHLAAAGRFLNPDEYVFAAYLTGVSQATGAGPLAVSQFLVAVIGTVPALVVVSVVRRVCARRDWKPSHTRIAATLAGLALAAEGVYLGRSAAVSSEMLGHALVLVTVIAFYRALRTERPAWMALTLVSVAFLPFTHNLGAMVAALALLAVFVRSLRRPTTRRVAFGIVVLVGFWTFTVAYYQFTGLAEASYVSSLPGLFLAWLVFLVAFVSLLPSVGTTVQRLVPAGLIVGVVTLLVANHFLPIFPGTAGTDALQLALLLPIAGIGLLAAWGLPRASDAGGPAVVVGSLLAAPLVLIGFALTGSLTHEYESLAVRSQIFTHFSMCALASLAVVDVGVRRTSKTAVRTAVRRLAVPLLALCVVASVPVAFAGLHATSAQPTVTPSEFATATFASNEIDGGWVGDGHVVILSTNYYPGRADARYTPLYGWLHGNGPPPNCPVVAQRSWTTVGAQLFPSSPTAVTTRRYDRWVARRNVVYSAHGRDPLVITTPRGSGTCSVDTGRGPAAGLSATGSGRGNVTRR
ncbi:putative sodium/phosphate symporter [Haladaptatus paucihalophilus DX253]|uniref:Putative sodium/phosphate symporter n=1 Tax=Haladaptatus paucihalophilus DX253 TaxID=797209 RepID=E7QVN3_HALPU|nr:hypothetical protein [Haladaptatus paucihalophilus]EFW91296.1 putative sodium/phosphate symporter [Haladaptatus paucihalophilus DX253]SHL09976.1 hypothetical protein SAMN05444342_3020 [Haladaptatus paucihalophilus DX253]